MAVRLGHEKLHVYQRALRFVGWAQEVLAAIDHRAAVADHLDRASESIVESIANGNSRRSAGDRDRFFDVAVGSGLECAACLDVCACKDLIPSELQVDGKTQLRSIVNMTIRLRESESPSVHETPGTYGTDTDGIPVGFFAHEGLDVYRVALELVTVLDRLVCDVAMGGRYSARLDKDCTSVVLNIAEGNGRFCRLDHRRFIDIAHTSAMGVASGLDVLAARGMVAGEQIGGAKGVLVRLVPLLLGLRGYLDEADEGASGATWASVEAPSSSRS
ncbi:MAG: hypothetical protein A3K19_20750 [Lentisphaerae bacterium RIFOXYB12_FULL_65_16]|nr:MAG: hypothetical protein A3K18_19175 [Lentisphaerae bacterium RIFOXYA12_64_32]OGV85216.1 MAG: hypothetical protein A3K19_20750 [Lentisphaerae bacterium RIFOXYB12_FULL_65_16]